MIGPGDKKPESGKEVKVTSRKPSYIYKETKNKIHHVPLHIVPKNACKKCDRPREDGEKQGEKQGGIINR
jgi:hypothetical protein